jgi:hypothetical protein
VIEKWQHIMNHGKCPSIGELKFYHDGKLPSGQKFIIENHLASCDMCNDLLEGLSNLDDHNAIDNAEKEIRTRLNEYLYKHEKKVVIIPLFWSLSVAASILLLFTSALLVFYLNNSRGKLITLSRQEVKPVLASKLDTSVIASKFTETEKQNQANSVSSPLIASRMIKNEVSKNEKKPFDEKRSIEVMTYQPEEISVQKEISVPVVAKMEFEKAEEEKPGLFVMRNAEKAKTDIGRRVVSGKVLSDDGNPLPGVNIQVKGTVMGVVSDLNGNFSLEVPDNNAKLIFSYVGYKTKEMAVDYQNNLEIAMAADIESFSEVVVVGYGTQKKSNLTGAVANVERKEYTDVSYEESKALTVQIDSLQNLLDMNKNDSTTLILLIEKSLELQDQHLALKHLENLQGQTTDKGQMKIIREINHLVQEKEYSKAIQKLKKMK